jgi:chemotaxis protein MotB
MGRIPPLFERLRIARLGQLAPFCRNFRSFSAAGHQLRRFAGLFSFTGIPEFRPRRQAEHAHIDPSEASATPSPEDSDRQRSYGARLKEDRKFSLASASLRQALQEMPEIAEASKHIMLEETKQGLNIEIVDQDGRSMFPEGGKDPYERTRKLLQKIAPQLKAMPYRLSIVGHTASAKVPPKPGYGPWELSADRANAVRQILESEGIPSGNVFMVAGKADTDPLFPDDPYMSPNRRITITLMREEPPLPDNLTP